MKKAKCKTVSIILYPLHIAKEGGLRKHSSIGLSVQKNRKDEPETKETGSLQGVGAYSKHQCPPNTLGMPTTPITVSGSSEEPLPSDAQCSCLPAPVWGPVQPVAPFAWKAFLLGISKLHSTWLKPPEPVSMVETSIPSLRHVSPYSAFFSWTGGMSLALCWAVWCTYTQTWTLKLITFFKLYFSIVFLFYYF